MGMPLRVRPCHHVASRGWLLRAMWPQDLLSYSYIVGLMHAFEATVPFVGRSFDGRVHTHIGLPLPVSSRRA